MTLEETLGPLLKARRLTLAAAESCTGGLIGHRLTGVPGSSEYFLGGIISYSNAAKERLLGVPAETLRTFGAVSEETARAMARGARRALGADLGVAVTGVAGPGGGTPEKPVGLTWLALSAPGIEEAQCHLWNGDREANKASSAEAALKLVEAYLLRPEPAAGVPQPEAEQMEPAEVEARFGVMGEITVLSFSWRGHLHAVASQGRQWRAADGWHFVVMASGERVFELLYTELAAGGAWQVTKMAGGRQLAA